MQEVTLPGGHAVCSVQKLSCSRLELLRGSSGAGGGGGGQALQLERAFDASAYFCLTCDVSRPLPAVSASQKY
jgi:hypothetical protein